MDAVSRFNAMTVERATAELLTCCAVPSWAATVVAGRPYADKGSLLTAADAAARALSWADVALGVSEHPRIGEPVPGAGRAAAWSRSEQAGAAQADGPTRDALAEVNRAYEQRFGHVYLIFASGRSQSELLDAARRRLGNDEATERDVVADELRRISLLRLERLVDALG